MRSQVVGSISGMRKLGVRGVGSKRGDCVYVCRRRAVCGFRSIFINLGDDVVPTGDFALATKAREIRFCSIKNRVLCNVFGWCEFEAFRMSWDCG